MSSCEINSEDPNLVGCSITFPRPNTTGGPIPSGVDGLLSWDDSIPDYVHTGIQPFQVENVIGIIQPINGAATPTTISTMLFGTFHVIINPTTANFPSASVTITKLDPASGVADSVVVHSAVSHLQETHYKYCGLLEQDYKFKKHW